MTSFEELGLRPELVETLAAEGIEIPTALQEDAIPVLRKGHSALLRGGPGAGVLVAWGAPLLDRLEPAPGGPVALVLTATVEAAVESARSLARISPVTVSAVIPAARNAAATASACATVAQKAIVRRSAARSRQCSTTASLSTARLSTFAAASMSKSLPAAPTRSRSSAMPRSSCP